MPPKMRRLILGLILALTVLVSPSLCASAATTFCKCTCKGNSTIIPLNPQTSSSTTNSPNTLLLRKDHRTRAESVSRKTHRASTCTDCNRKFCLSYNLPGCKGVKEEEFFTTCFQRDSLKDEAVVFIFIFATAGLLVWALLKPYVQKWLVKAQEERRYVPLPDHEGGGQSPTQRAL